jgi:hypothetical protein
MFTRLAILVGFVGLVLPVASHAAKPPPPPPPPPPKCVKLQCVRAPLPTQNYDPSRGVQNLTPSVPIPPPNASR